MKKLLLLPFCALLAILTSCDIHFSENGDLDGFWQLARIDTIGGGGIDTRPQRLFWSVQSDLLQVSDLNYLHDSYVWRFEHVNNTLRLHSPYCVDHAGNDIAVNDVRNVQPWGIPSLDQTFSIELLDDLHMTLSTADLRLQFNRY